VSEFDQLTGTNVRDYLRAAGTLQADAPVHVTALGGGISNRVFKVTCSEGCLVLKQSLQELRVTAHWSVDRGRTLVERDCLSLLGRIVPGCVPDVVFCDEQRYVLVMSCVAPSGVLWKEALMAGRVDTRAAAHAGELLGRIHRLAASDSQACQQFSDQTVLVQARIDPYHLTAAAAHPALAPAIEREVERLLSTQLTLTLGDYSPKNIFIYPDRVMAIDFEVAHWGDPAFDVAFCLAHLALKALHRAAHADAYLAAAARFWAYYRHQDDKGRCSERAVVSELGCLLLARIDGKSPVEYINDETTKDRVRELARRLITGHGDSVPAALLEVCRSVPGPGCGGSGTDGDTTCLATPDNRHGQARAHEQRNSRIV